MNPAASIEEELRISKRDSRAARLATLTLVVRLVERDVEEVVHLGGEEARRVIGHRLHEPRGCNGAIGLMEEDRCEYVGHVDVELHRPARAGRPEPAREAVRTQRVSGR